MDPLSVVSASAGVISGVAKASLVLFQFSRDFRDSGDDLVQMADELRALAAIVDPLSSTLTRNKGAVMAEPLLEQIDSTLSGCSLVVEQVSESLQKYQRDTAWTKAKWPLYGHDDVKKLCESIKVYNLALSVSLQAVSLNLGQDIKDDTDKIKIGIGEVKLATDEILAKVDSIRQMGARPSAANAQVQQWIDDISMLSNYAESTYKATILDADDFMEREKLPPVPGSSRATSLHESDKLSPAAEDARSSPPDYSRDNTFEEKSATSTSNSASRKEMKEVNTENKKDSLVNLSKLIGSDDASRPVLSHTEPPPRKLPQVALNNKVSSEISLSFSGLQFISDKIASVALAARPDQETMKESQARRQLLNEAARRDLDDKFYHISKWTSGRDIREFVAQGADIHGHRSGTTYASSALTLALVHNNNDCLYALLQCGATAYSPLDHNIESRENPYKPWDFNEPFHYAVAKNNEEAVWALVAADALKGLFRGDTLYNLFKALCEEPCKDMKKRVRILKFIMANGLDVKKRYGDDRFLDDIYPLQEALSTWRDKSNKIVNPLVKVFLDAGATINFDSAWGHPCEYAARTNNVKLLNWVAPQFHNQNSKMWANSICIAANTASFDAFRILAMEPYARNDNLHMIVMKHILNHTDRITAHHLEAAVQIILQCRGRKALDQRVYVEYTAKRNFLGRCLNVRENVSVLELVDRIQTPRGVSRTKIKKQLMEIRPYGPRH